MKVSGFTIAKDVIKYNYPVQESILSILPICDEFIVNVAKSEDSTLNFIKSIASHKIKIIETQWDFENGANELAKQTNFCLSKCSGDWAFYIQSDEVIHERDLPILKKMMLRYVDNSSVDAIRFRYFHFYGSFYRYRVDAGWYQKEDRIIRNNNLIKSIGDAKGFARIDGKELKKVLSPCYVYHYGWVQKEDIMKKKQVNAAKLGYGHFTSKEEKEDYCFYNIRMLPIYFGTHPRVMNSQIKKHKESIRDYNYINKKYFWNPLLWFKIRNKTFKRIKTTMPK